jgi:excinuclease ABC subunit A
MKIQYLGITTNNVKDIDLEIEQGNVVFFSGPSGSGKSSIVVDTIHKISEDEFFQLCNLREDISAYSIRDYDNILPSVCLQQENYNRNPRSTIATYFNIDIHFKELFSLVNNVSKIIFQFNTKNTWCESCNGLGTKQSPDLLAIIDYDCKIEDLPFRPWRISDRDYYTQSLQQFCEEHAIDSSKKFQQLSNKQQEILLHGESAEKYKIVYCTNGRKHTKTAAYRGPVAELQKDFDNNKIAKSRVKYFGNSICGNCGGSRFLSSVSQYKLFGKSIGELYLMEVDALFEWIKQNEKQWKDKHELARPFRKIIRFLESLVRLNLNYIQLNRSIPSLSGGELQRLRLGKAITSHFTNFLYVLDEPTSGLHPSEWQTISDVVVELKKHKNTVIVIEHNEFLCRVSDRVVCVGPGGGKNGGYIVSPKEIKNVVNEHDCRFFQSTASVSICNAAYNNVQNLNIDIPLNTLIGVCGVSGSGKSSFLRGILPRFLEGTQYFSQSPILGNTYSIVATAVNILGDIEKLFVDSTNGKGEYFRFSSRGKGQCPNCLGRGIINEESAYLPGAMICPTCGGQRFGADTYRYKIAGRTIFDYLNMSITELQNIISPNKSTKLTKTLALLSSVGLGYLTLFQNTSTLSGGEAQRIKFAANLLAYKRKQTYLLDEPFRGVDKANICNIRNVLYKLVEDGSTVFIAEHNPFALNFCSYLIEFGPASGKYGGKVLYSGKLSECTKCKMSIIKDYLVN